MTLSIYFQTIFNLKNKHIIWCMLSCSRKFLDIKPKFCVFHIDRYRVHCQSLWHTDYYLAQKHTLVEDLNGKFVQLLV